MKNKINITALRCIAAMLLFPLWGLGGFALFAQSNITITPTGADYAA
jgi:hypothetical protein